MEIIHENIKEEWYKSPIVCPLCKSIFTITASDDIDVFFNSDTMDTKRVTSCPLCWERILIDLKSIRREEGKIWQKELKKKKVN